MAYVRSSVLGVIVGASLVVSCPQANEVTWQENIKNVVVLVQENRSFDWFFGDLSYSKDIDNIRNLNSQFCNPANVAVANSTQVCAEARAANVSPDDPGHSISDVTFYRARGVSGRIFNAK
ncbi:hypothetical protein BDQ17DRAFT_1429829 [Cyathus striatus]|nr:hypothetical protein BDQ17DRAFT_1429829 [Cyathus striatus]